MAELFLLSFTDNPNNKEIIIIIKHLIIRLFILKDL